MEKNQLNFNLPLISARRYSSPIRSSENVQKNRTEKPLTHRRDSQPQQKLQKSDWELSEVAEPGTVPFLWEKIPGKAKEERKPESQTNTPRLPPRIERSPLNISGNLVEMMKKGPNMDYENHSASGDDGYSDALDALSFSDSRSMSCSVSGLSDYFNNSDTKTQGKFSADIQTRDFMMNRFLPAAKAMILKAPQYSSKKQHPVVEKPEEKVNTFVIGERKPRMKHDISHFVPNYGKYKDEMESENGIDEFEAIKKTPRKAFGLFAKFCLKNSLGLLNQVPGIKSKIGSSMNTSKKSLIKKNPAKEVGKMIRKAYSGPLTQIPDKNPVNSFPKRRTDSISRSQELYTVKSKPYFESPRQSHSGELRMTRGSSPYRSYTRGGLSPYRNEIPNSPIRKSPSFIGVTRSGEKMKVVKSPIIPKIEKTVCIDHVQSTNGVDILGEEEIFESKKESIIIKADEKDSVDLATIHPPLPKSPSESWLWRTLPSINRQFSSKNKQNKASNTGAKWETIVKISNVHHDHMRYSEELVPHLLQRRKT